MTRKEFDDFVYSARERGFKLVKTAGGPIPLSAWRPYGAFDGCNPGIERHIEGFVWLDANRAGDGEPHTGFASGVWEFC